ncbi:hypothetical protein QR685DRAFT_24928 [Neurospora intermedia]|uniref:Uncharacterized protein n=1 Tax=Neurospora intermedia TaxID=5142 RepID=A0ABR3DSK3_NEUIN
MSIYGHDVPRAKHGVSMLSSKLGISLLVPCHSWSQMDMDKVRRRPNAGPSYGRWRRRRWWWWWWRTGYRGRSSVKIRDIANMKSIEDGEIARVKPVLVNVALMSLCSGCCQLH